MERVVHIRKSDLGCAWLCGPYNGAVTYSIGLTHKEGFSEAALRDRGLTPCPVCFGGKRSLFELAEVL